MKVISGKIDKAQKIVLYAPEGFGKSTFASHFPKPIFIDVEGGTNLIACDRTEKPESFAAIVADVKDAINSGYKTIVLDTIDWTERLSLEQVCRENDIPSIESIGYGKGYTYNLEKMGKFLNLLQDAVEKGKNVVVLAHCMMRKQERPNDPAFDRYELKLTKQTAPLVKEWADMLLFANYKYIVYEEKGTKKKKASGGKRVMYTTHNPCWDAKNRHDLPDEMEFDYASIAHCIPGDAAYKGHAETDDKVATKEPPPRPEPISNLESVKEEPAKEEPAKVDTKPGPEQTTAEDVSADTNTELDTDMNDIAPELVQLMKRDKIKSKEIMEVVQQRQAGVFPADMKLENLPNDFVFGWVIKFWDSVVKMVQKNRNDVPF